MMLEGGFGFIFWNEMLKKLCISVNFLKFLTLSMPSNQSTNKMAATECQMKLTTHNI